MEMGKRASSCAPASTRSSKRPHRRRRVLRPRAEALEPGLRQGRAPRAVGGPEGRHCGRGGCTMMQHCMRISRGVEVYHDAALHADKPMELLVEVHLPWYFLQEAKVGCAAAPASSLLRASPEGDENCWSSYTSPRSSTSSAVPACLVHGGNARSWWRDAAASAHGLAERAGELVGNAERVADDGIEVASPPCDGASARSRRTASHALASSSSSASRSIRSEVLAAPRVEDDLGSSSDEGTQAAAMSNGSGCLGHSSTAQWSSDQEGPRSMRSASSSSAAHGGSCQ
ncbi:hypothetical protein SEVIR_9G556701v4 [Setaria viridis]|uniref:Uncharacterized protein n=1 Tax=Setaria viridis TaxID=4556 RepID=A0A4U6TC95_SETVI|nr:hypothetical protein SEVIR_9G556701v2 [Setaria viridis]